MQPLVEPSPLTHRRRGIAADANKVRSGCGSFDKCPDLVVAVNRRIVLLASLLKRGARRNRKNRPLATLAVAIDRPLVVAIEKIASTST